MYWDKLIALNYNRLPIGKYFHSCLGIGLVASYSIGKRTIGLSEHLSVVTRLSILLHCFELSVIA